jgi:hypothetical protein
MNNIDNQDKILYRNFINKQSKNKEDEAKAIKEQLNIKPYTSLDPNNPPELTIPLLAFSVTSIYSDLLAGMARTLKKVNDGEIKLENIKFKGGAEPNKQQMIQKNDDSLKKVNHQSQELDKQVNHTAKQVNDKLNEHYDKLSQEGNKLLQYVLKKWLYLSEVFVNKLINNTLKYTNDDLVNKPWDQLLPEFNEKIVILAATLNELANNPATKEAIKEIAEALSISAIELIDAIEPSVMQVINRSVSMGEEIGDKSARGAMNTAIAFAQALIAEVPYIGGIIDFVIAIGKAFNTVGSIFRVYTERSSDISIEAAEGVKKEADTVERAEKRITKAVDNAQKKIKEAKNSINNITDVTAPSGTIPTVSTSVPTSLPTSSANFTQQGGKRLSKSLKEFLSCEPKRKFTLKKYGHKKKIYTRKK